MHTAKCRVVSQRVLRGVETYSEAVGDQSSKPHCNEWNEGGGPSRAFFRVRMLDMLCGVVKTVVVQILVGTKGRCVHHILNHVQV